MPKPMCSYSINLILNPRLALLGAAILLLFPTWERNKLYLSLSRSLHSESNKTVSWLPHKTALWLHNLGADFVLPLLNTLSLWDHLLLNWFHSKPVPSVYGLHAIYLPNWDIFRSKGSTNGHYSGLRVVNQLYSGETKMCGHPIFKSPRLRIYVRWGKFWA